MKMTDGWRRLLSQSSQREHGDFLDWLKNGGLREPEDREERARARELYEFCQWVSARNAAITEAMPLGLVAADVTEYRRYEPEGGLCIEHWPYLKVCCAAVGDEDFTRICRDEIVEAILVNQLQKKGYSSGGAASAVDDLVREADESDFGPFWTIVEQVSFEEIVADLEQRAEAITKKLADARRERQKNGGVHIDGPDDNGLRVFWWRGKWYHLSPTEFRWVSILWAAPERSLPLWELLQKLWGVRPAANPMDHTHRLSQRALEANNHLSGTGIRVRLGKDHLGYERVYLKTP